MIQNIEIPEEVPVMTLSNTVLFPQAIMPIFIFEPRYKKMLTDVLAQNRIFAIATLDERTQDAASSEAAYSTAGIGLIRACKKNADGNSNLVLQGISRVKFTAIISEVPYRRARVQEISSKKGGSQKQINSYRDKLIRLVHAQCRLGANIPKEILKFLSSIEEPENLLDLAIYTLCPSTILKQELLETRNIVPRYQKFTRFLESEIQNLKLNIQLKGDLNDENIGHN